MRSNKIGIVREAKGLLATANLRMFSLADLGSATRGFSPDMILGENNYGRAFIGWLHEDTLAPSRIGIVGIKSLNSYGRYRTMQSEVDLCGRFYHPNVIKPPGFCLEGQEFLLVHEYTPKGNVARYAYKDCAQVEGAIIASDSGRYSTAMEVVCGKDHIKPFEINHTRITFSKKVCQIFSTSIRPLSVIISSPKNLCYNGIKNSRVDSRVSQNKAGIIAEANNRMRSNKIGIVPEAKGLFAIANLRKFSLAELGGATRGFSPDMILVENHYGRVFIGWLDEDTLAPSRIGIGMAVSIMSLNSYGRFRVMQAEVDLCGRFYHPNVIKPLGFCSEGQELLLVYEYAQKGNVARYAYKDTRKSLSWVVWLKILVGAARYLDFLHSSDDHIIFGDFTLSSILLDWDFNAKVGVSVIARFGPDDGDALVTDIPNLNAQHRAVSEGFLSPEYKKAGRLSSKNDVYAFGVVLLEILTGIRVIDVNARDEKNNLVDKARPVLACERKVKRVVNPKLLEKENCPKVVTSILSDVPALALKCLDLDPKKRPSMRQVVEINSIRTTKKDDSYSAVDLHYVPHLTRPPSDFHHGYTVPC
ncbi:Protein kinase domain-containing protein [Heracleum sosnowskyi]|uniref:Protein kinase domain-containing protein n=1 Tax=Heracleum sosnowskyi TaxID=360622 RepID=A0AAD8MPC4_9APIA|nr:Protein kinase domain-containing protein [Heracleum sosnowskyi]